MKSFGSAHTSFMNGIPFSGVRNRVKAAGVKPLLINAVGSSIAAGNRVRAVRHSQFPAANYEFLSPPSPRTSNSADKTKLYSLAYVFSSSLSVLLSIDVQERGAFIRI